MATQKHILAHLDELSTMLYKEYGLATLEDRAIGDYRDGFGPVHRRLLIAAKELGITSSAKHVKSARIVGECFAEGTLVTLADGADIPIEDLKIGDMVKTDVSNEPVTELYALEEKDLYEVATDKGIVLATPDQIFFCLDIDGKEIERTPLTLKKGDTIKTYK